MSNCRPINRVSGVNSKNLNLILLDRDGVINMDSPDFIKNPDEWQPLPNAIAAIVQLQRQFKVAICTNQSGISRGLLSEDTLAAIHAKLNDLVQSSGGNRLPVFYCPHHPDDNCPCRKPQPGLLQAAIQIADLFLSEGDIVSVKGRNVKERSWAAHELGTYPDFPIAVLVNTYSASASEVLSACLQDNKRALIVGERTWGKGSVQNIIQMEDGDSALKLTTASYHRPSGVNIHRFRGMKVDETWGVKPDEGFDLPYTAGEWREWDDDRSRRDVLAAAGTEPVESTFEDRQLVAAVGWLKEQIQGSTADVPADAAADATEDSVDEAPQPAAVDTTSTAQPAPAPTAADR